MKLITIAAISTLAACSPSVSTPSGDPDAVSKAERGEVVLVAKAPDGTKLWAVKPSGGRTVYFSAGGTQTHYTESCGKNCTRTVDDIIPNEMRNIE